MKKLRWKKDPIETGLGAVCVNSTLRGSKLWDGETVYARVESLSYYQLARGRSGWYWHTTTRGLPFYNTAVTPAATEAEAKAQAMAYVKKYLESI